MKRVTLLTLLVVLSLACGMAAPVAETPVPTATARAIPTYPEPTEAVNYNSTDFGAKVCMHKAETDTNVRECASVSCDTTGLWIYKGETISAACNVKWALVVVDGRAGYVCIAAMTGAGGCE